MPLVRIRSVRGRSHDLPHGRIGCVPSGGVLPKTKTPHRTMFTGHESPKRK
jgi:hypothetical protein